MSGENKFYALVWLVISITVLGVTLITTEYWKDHNTKIVELINSGVNPVAAMCAMQDDYGNQPTCIILATKK